MDRERQDAERTGRRDSGNRTVHCRWSYSQWILGRYQKRDYHPRTYAAGDVAGGCPQKYVTGALAEGKIASFAIIEQLKSDSDETTSTIEKQAQVILKDYEKIRSTQNGLFTIDDLEEAMQKLWTNMQAESQAIISLMKNS